MPGIEIDAAYLPGTESLDIGGDWHDAFLLPNQAIGLVIGDVVGHGLEAAIAMAQLRGAARALAAVSSPAQLLDRLDTFVDSLPDAYLATLAYVELHPSSGVMRYACAGHPPPLIVSGRGETRFLWGARSTPLGVRYGNRSEAVARLRDAERLVLYTDGLVERRHQSIDSGLQRLRVSSRHDVSSTDFVARLCRSMLSHTPQHDDVCVLSVTARGPDTFTVSIPAQMPSIAGVRATLREWFGRRGLGEMLVSDLVLAISEAMANAIEHSSPVSGEDEPYVGLVVSMSHEEISILVRDHGSWRTPSVDPLRGRGLVIMGRLMDSVAVTTDEGGTVVNLRRALDGSDVTTSPDVRVPDRSACDEGDGR